MVPTEETGHPVQPSRDGFPGGGFPGGEYLCLRRSPDWSQTECRVATTAAEILGEYLRGNIPFPLSQQVTLRGSGKKKAINMLIARRVVLGGIKLTHGDPVLLEILFGYRAPERRRARRKRFSSAAFTQFRHRLGIDAREVRLGWGLLPEEAAWLVQFAPRDGIQHPGLSIHEGDPTQAS